MLEIRINGHSIDLARDTPTSFEKLNPYFTYEDIYTDKVSVPAIPLSQKNRRIFGYIDLPALGSDLPRFQIQKFYNGQLIHEGLALVTDIGASTLQLTAVQPIGEFFGDYQFMRLADIDFGTLPVPGVLTPVISDAGMQAFAFPTIVNPDYYGTNGPAISYSGKVNDYASGSYAASGPKCPMPFLRYVLKKIADVTGVTFTGTFLADPACVSGLLYNTRALDGAGVITLSRHLPELTLIGLFIELRKYLNLSFTFDTVNRVLQIDRTDDILRAAATEDWSYKLVKGARKIPERNRRLQLSMTLDGGDQAVKDKPAELADFLTPEFADDLSIAKLQTSFSTLTTDIASGLATAKQTGCTAEFGQLTATWAPRLLFWNGLVGGKPKAGNTLGGQTLFWVGAGGVVERYWTVTEAFRRQMCYLDAQLILTESDIALLDFRKPVHINGMNYFIVRVAGNLPIDKPMATLLVQTS